MAADKQIKHTIEEDGVMFSQRVPETPQLFTRVYKVDPDTFL